MNRRVLPIVIAACLLSLAATGVAAQQPLADGAGTKAQYDKAVERQKARKASVAAAEQARTDKLAPKSVTQRGTVAPAEPAAATRPAPPAVESFHDCHGTGNDA